jgi:protection of telomeres protein 1
VSRTEKRNQTKNQKKSQKKKEKKKQQKRDAAAAAAAAAASPENADGNEAEAAEQIAVATRKSLNTNIRCGHQEVPIRPIRFILDPDNKIHTVKMPNGTAQVVPFVNAKYRTRARVIDYMPKKVEDFTMPVDDPRLGPPGNPYSSQSHEWCFQLLLEDATKAKTSVDAKLDTVWVGLHHEEAQYLFGNNVGDPKDLRQDATLLAKVKQQLFLLWGNLEEKEEDEELSNLPFECCLMEHGVPMNDSDPCKATTPFGYIRLYAMFGTTIL